MNFPILNHLTIFVCTLWFFNTNIVSAFSAGVKPNIIMDNVVKPTEQQTQAEDRLVMETKLKIIEILQVVVK